MPLRLLAKDITVLQAGTLNVLALFSRGSIEISADLVETSALKDDWYSAGVRRKSWRATVTALIEGDPYDFLNAVAQASEVSPLTLTCTVTIPGTAPTTKTFTGSCLPSSSTLTLEDVLTREITFTGIGAPTIS